MKGVFIAGFFLTVSLGLAVLFFPETFNIDLDIRRDPKLGFLTVVLLVLLFFGIVVAAAHKRD